MYACAVSHVNRGSQRGFACKRAQVTVNRKNWYTTIPGFCQDRSIQTALSYAVAVVSILSDWIFAILPIFLLWNVQLDWRVKCSVVGMLGLGVL